MNKNITLFTLLLLIFSCQTVSSQVPHNSKRFIISNYFYPETDGDYTRYRAHGFAQPHTSQSKGRIFMLPIIYRDSEEIRFIDEYGLEFDPLSRPNKLARTIIIPISITSKLPNRFQLPAIAGALEDGMEQSHYMPPMVKGPNDSFHILPAAQNLMPLLEESTREYQKAVAEQQAVIELYSNYAAELVSLSEMEVTVVLENETIVSRVYGDVTFITDGRKTNIEVVAPTLYQQNRIAAGDVEVFVSYKFRDAKTSTIDARFDAKRIVNQFLKETQESMVRGSSSGWQILGFGSRRKKVRSSFNNSVQSNYKGEEYESTSVEMFDASEDMIAEFERDFFPVLSKQKVIENHLAAAESAGNSGNEALRDLHLKYANSLEMDDPNLEVDIAGAVASLAAKDYAGFIAKGVRWGSHTGSNNSSFRRVVQTDAEFESKKAWSQMRTVSVQHALTENVGVLKEDRQQPSMGMCGVMQYTYPFYTQNIYGQWITSQKQGMMPSCIVKNSPAHISGLVPGMIIASMGGKQITTGADYLNLMEEYEPGDIITLKIVEYQGYQAYERDLNIKLASGTPITD